MAKIDEDGKRIIQREIKSSLESLADICAEKAVLSHIQPQLQHVFEVLFDIQNKWEVIEDKKQTVTEYVKK